jgi:hypothetical protein
VLLCLPIARLVERAHRASGRSACCAQVGAAKPEVSSVSVNVVALSVSGGLIVLVALFASSVLIVRHMVRVAAPHKLLLVSRFAFFPSLRALNSFSHVSQRPAAGCSNVPAGAQARGGGARVLGGRQLNKS